ncbi:hypothetical protein ABPG72_022188 [Tetrahymena utriculariae]
MGNFQSTQQKCKAQRLVDTTIIWGDYNNNKDNQFLIDYFAKCQNFRKDNIIYCLNESDFYRKISKCQKKNSLIIMSGRFATQENFQNLNYVDQLIKNRQISCRYSLIYTSEQTINQQKWSLPNLQSQYPSLMALEYDHNKLIQQLLDLVYNLSHIPFELQENLLYYLSSEQDIELINLFTESQNFDLKKQQRRLKIEDIKFKQLIELLKKVNSESPLDKFKDENLIQKFLLKINKCYEQNNNNKKSQILQEADLINNLINLFSKEGEIYKLINFTLCTINPLIYQCMKPVYKIFSSALAKYKDQNQTSQLKLFRGSLISKSFYQQIALQFVLNQSKNQETFIFFPSFTSTTLKKEVAQYLVAPEQIQMQTQILSSFENMSYEVYELIYTYRPFLLKNIVLNQFQQGNHLKKIQKEVYQIIKQFRPFLLQNQNLVQNSQINQQTSQQFSNQNNEELEIQNNNQVELIKNEEQEEQINKNDMQQFLQNDEKDEEFKNHDEEDFRQLPKDISNFYRVIFHIKADINIENPYKPKYISKISEYSEEEFLFQPFSKFKVLDISEPNNLGNNDQAVQFHKIYLEYKNSN